MIPTREDALRELDAAYALNPGPWREHSINAAMAAGKIAAECGLDRDRAYVSGLLHDIGRRTGISQMRHLLDGYDYCISKGWVEIAGICLTHSFPSQNAESDIGKRDITEEQFSFLKEYLSKTEYSEYDRLIILCDALATAKGLCILEKRLVDTSRRYGIYSFTLERWNATFAIKEHFDTLCKKSIYRCLPGIESCIYD